MPITGGRASEGILQSKYMGDLHDHYKKFFSAYSTIVHKYEVACTRASAARKKLTFPDKSSWNPTGRSLSPTERLLLLGPVNDVLYYQSFCVRDPNTNRCVTYGIHQPGIAQAKNSFVFLKETCEYPSLD